MGKVTCYKLESECISLLLISYNNAEQAVTHLAGHVPRSPLERFIIDKSHVQLYKILNTSVQSIDRINTQWRSSVLSFSRRQE